MTWPADASPVAALLRDQIAAAGAADGITVDRVHHPTSNPSGAVGTQDPLSHVLIESIKVAPKVIADGIAVVTGSAELVLYTPDDLGTAGTEALAQRLLSGLLAQQVGLVWRDGCDSGDASGPSAPIQAAAATQEVIPGQPGTPAPPTPYRSCPIHLVFGLEG